MSCRRRWPSRMPSRPWYRRRQGWPTPQLAWAALRDRQDLVALQSQIAVAQAGIDLARSGGRPAVFLGAGYEFSNFSGQSPYVFGSWLATLSVTLSVFDGGITQAKVSEAQLQLDQLKIREAQTRQQIELDVRLAWLALQQATGR
ncbi:MAG: TolC family protein, partial [Bacillati bacterium ANGP1]